VTKRHHTSRRKTYGRRQHELRERPDQRAVPEHMLEATADDWATGSTADTFSFLDPRPSRVRFVLGD
jgi:hypothetical protein